eukprot:654353_1
MNRISCICLGYDVFFECNGLWFDMDRTCSRRGHCCVYWRFVSILNHLRFGGAVTLSICTVGAVMVSIGDWHIDCVFFTILIQRHIRSQIISNVNSKSRLQMSFFKAL